MITYRHSHIRRHGHIQTVTYIGTGTYRHAQIYTDTLSMHTVTATLIAYTHTHGYARSVQVATALNDMGLLQGTVYTGLITRD